MVGVIEFTGDLIGTALTLSPEVLLLLIFAFSIIAFKVFGFILRAVMTGVVFAFFPLAASYLGWGIPVTISSMVTFALLGIVFYLVYGSLKFGFKITKLVMFPFRRTFKKKEKAKVIAQKESN